MVTLTSPWAPHVYVTSLSLPKTRPSLHFTCSLSIDLRFSLVTEDSVLRPEKEPIRWLGEEFCIWSTQWKSIFCVMRLWPSDVWGKRSSDAAGSQISAVQENNNGLYRERQNLLTSSMTFLPGNIVKLVLCTNEKQLFPSSVHVATSGADTTRDWRHDIVFIYICLSIDSNVRRGCATWGRAAGETGLQRGRGRCRKLFQSSRCLEGEEFFKREFDK